MSEKDTGTRWLPVASGVMLELLIERRSEMDQAEMKVLCELMMVSDPWPLDDAARNTLEAWLDREAKRHGFSNWIEAYHAL